MTQKHNSPPIWAQAALNEATQEIVKLINSSPRSPSAGEINTCLHETLHSYWQKEQETRPEGTEGTRHAPIAYDGETAEQRIAHLSHRLQLANLYLHKERMAHEETRARSKHYEKVLIDQMNSTSALQPKHFAKEDALSKLKLQDPSGDGGERARIVGEQVPQAPGYELPPEVEIKRIDSTLVGAPSIIWMPNDDISLVGWMVGAYRKLTKKEQALAVVDWLKKRILRTPDDAILDNGPEVKRLAGPVN